MRAAETDGRPGKGEDGKARTREVKLACAFTQTKVDEDGYPIRDPDSSSYLATFAPAAEFGTLMAAEARRRGAGHVRQLTILGDGAHWIWNQASQLFPRSHPDRGPSTTPASTSTTSASYSPSCSATSTPPGSPDAASELDDGDIETLLSAARAFPLTGTKAGELDTALGYFETNAPRMRYNHFRSCGLFVGSGAVEAGCKAVIGQRLKLSGMHWSQRRRHRHPHPALPESQRPLGRNLATAVRPHGQQPEPVWRSPHNSDHPRPGQVTGQSPTFLSSTPYPGTTTGMSEGTAKFGPGQIQ